MRGHVVFPKHHMTKDVKMFGDKIIVAIAT